MTDDELRQLAETVVQLPDPAGRIADGPAATFVRWLRTLAAGVLRLLEDNQRLRQDAAMYRNAREYDGNQ